MELLTILVPVLVLALVVLLVASIRVTREHEQAIVIRNGRVLDKTRGPGLFLVIPFGVDKLMRVDTRVAVDANRRQ
jgi:regulator of protease activity HflC (stomatin/prohibitin superfamily)